MCSNYKVLSQMRSSGDCYLVQCKVLLVLLIPLRTNTDSAAIFFSSAVISGFVELLDTHT